MPQLTITFTPVAGATGYQVCYKLSSSLNYTCASYAGSPVVISSGIECGENYDVTVKTLCANGLESSVVGALATKVECPPQAYCYTVNIAPDLASGNFIAYNPIGSTSPTTVAVNSLTLSNGFYTGSFCSIQAVHLVNGSLAVQSLTQGSSIIGGTVPCTTNNNCQ